MKDKVFNPRDTEIASMYGTALLFFLQQVEEKALSPDICMAFFIEHPTQPEWVDLKDIEFIKPKDFLK